MPIVNANKTAIVVGRGDVCMVECEFDGTPDAHRYLFVMRQTCEGVIGDADARPEGHQTISYGPLPDDCIIVEAENLAGLDSLIDGLQMYRAELVKRGLK